MTDEDHVRDPERTDELEAVGRVFGRSDRERRHRQIRTVSGEQRLSLGRRVQHFYEHRLVVLPVPFHSAESDGLSRERARLKSLTYASEQRAPATAETTPASSAAPPHP